MDFETRSKSNGCKAVACARWHCFPRGDTGRQWMLKWFRLGHAYYKLDYRYQMFSAGWHPSNIVSSIVVSCYWTRFTRNIRLINHFKTYQPLIVNDITENRKCDASFLKRFWWETGFKILHLSSELYLFHVNKWLAASSGWKSARWTERLHKMKKIFTAIIPVTVTLCTANDKNKENIQTAQWSSFSEMHLHNSVCTSGQKQRLGREGMAEARAAVIRSVPEWL